MGLWVIWGSIAHLDKGHNTHPNKQCQGVFRPHRNASTAPPLRRTNFSSAVPAVQRNQNIRTAPNNCKMRFVIPHPPSTPHGDIHAAPHSLPRASSASRNPSPTATPHVSSVPTLSTTPGNLPPASIVHDLAYSFPTPRLLDRRPEFDCEIIGRERRIVGPIQRRLTRRQ